MASSAAVESAWQHWRSQILHAREYVSVLRHIVLYSPFVWSAFLPLESQFRAPVKGETFHDKFLRMLRPLYDQEVCQMYDVSASYQRAPPPAPHAWPRDRLHQFLTRFFLVYGGNPSAFASLCSLFDAQGKPETLLISFEDLRVALIQDVEQRLLRQDQLPLMPVVYCITAIDLTAVPPLSTPENQPRTRSYGIPAPPKNDMPLLRDFHAEVYEKSSSWLSRWQPRWLFLRRDTLEIARKSSAMATRLSSSFSSAMPAVEGADGSSQLYALTDLLSLQLSLCKNDAEIFKRPTVTLHFKHPVVSGGHTTKVVVLACDTNERAESITSQIATFSLVSGLVRAQSAPTLERYIGLGARLDVFSVIPGVHRGDVMTLSPLQLALIGPIAADNANTSFDERGRIVRLLLWSQADPRLALQWSFFTRVLWSRGSRAQVKERIELLLSEALDAGSSLLPFGSVVANDSARWNLLMYLCYYGEVDAVKRLVMRLSRLPCDNCFEVLDHINAAGDSALHIALKAVLHDHGEEIALLLVDLAARKDAVCRTRDSDGDDIFTNADDSSAESVFLDKKYIHSQLLRLVDRSGDSVLHLALRARMWSLMDKLLDYNAMTPVHWDAQGDMPLHLAIRVGASVDLIARMVSLFESPMQSLQNESHDHRGHDSPLTLAIKHRRQEIVEILLAHGAFANNSSCHWTRQIQQQPDTTHSAIEDGDTPLHVAIKSGLEQAACSLVAHGALLMCLDSHGASPLALAIRYGMYKLGFDMASQLAAKSPTSSSSAESRWIDEETGMPVVALALDAGQFELAMLLLDMDPRTHLSLVHARSGETLLHRAITTIARLHLAEKDLIADEDSELAFFESAMEQFVLSLLHGMDNVCMVLSPVQLNPQVDHQELQAVEEWTTPLHSATVYGNSTTTILLYLLAFLHDKGTSEEAIIQLLSTATKINGETPLHCALRSKAAQNALVLLFYHRLLHESENAQDTHTSRRLISRIFDGRTRSDGNTPLHLACCWPMDSDMLVVIEILLARRVRGAVVAPVQWNKRGFMPLHEAVIHACDGRAISLFHRFVPQDLNLWTEGAARTPLMLAVENGNAAAVRALIECDSVYTNLVTPQTRCSLIHLAVYNQIQEPMLLRALLSCHDSTEYLDDGTDADGMTTLSAIEILRSRLSEANASLSLQPGNQEDDAFLPILPAVEQQTTAIPATDMLDESVLAFLKRQELQTLAFVAQQTREDAMGWLQTPLGKRYLLAASQALHDKAKSEREQDDPALGYQDDSFDADKQSESIAALFIETEIANAVFQAQRDIESEKKAIAIDTGVAYP